MSVYDLTDRWSLFHGNSGREGRVLKRHGEGEGESELGADFTSPVLPSLGQMPNEAPSMVELWQACT